MVAALPNVDSSRIARYLRLTAKSMYHHVLVRHQGTKKILFIVGCQRSGTTLLNSIFERDPRASVYDEQGSAVSRSSGAKLRLRSLDEVADVIARDPAPIVVLKPLVESQNILELLDRFEDSVAVWIYRHYADVAASYVRKWNDDRSVSDLRSIIEDRDDWRNEKVTPTVRKTVIEHFDDRMAPHDASALYWFVRNSHFFELDLARDDRILLCRYEDLVRRPRDEVARLYNLLQIPPPRQATTKDVHRRSVNKGADVMQSAPIDALCADLLAEMDVMRRRRRGTLA